MQAPRICGVIETKRAATAVAREMQARRICGGDLNEDEMVRKVMAMQAPWNCGVIGTAAPTSTCSHPMQAPRN